MSRRRLYIIFLVAALALACTGPDRSGPQVADSTPEVVPAEPQVADSTPQIAESAPQPAESTPQPAESAPQPAESTPEVAPAEPPPKPEPKQKPRAKAKPAPSPQQAKAPEPPKPEPPPALPPVKEPPAPLPADEIVPILGKKVIGPAGEDLGRVVNVLVDQRGRTRAAVIDFGGFMGVGSRRIAVDWDQLVFKPGTWDRSRSVILSMTREQIQGASEYRERKDEVEVVTPPVAGQTPTGKRPN
jgi:PRC-barrel domain